MSCPPFKISLKNNPAQPLENSGHESLLDTLRRAGIEVPTSCENGVCATCKGKIVQGTVSYPEIEPSGLMPDEEAQGEALFCCAYPQSDCLIDHPDLLLPGESPARFFKVKLNKSWEITPQVMGLELSIDGPASFKFLAGQYLELIIGSKRYPFSITNTPAPDQNPNPLLTLHIIHSDPSTENLLIKDIQAAEKLMVYGPKGRAHLRQNHQGDLVFIAGGGGITPMLSMIPEALKNNSATQAIYLYWGVRNLNLLYQKDYFENLKLTYPHFHFIPVNSDSSDSSKTTGLVHEQFLKDFKKFNNPLIYTAGPPLMIQKIKDALEKLHFPQEKLLGDGV